MQLGFLPLQEGESGSGAGMVEGDPAGAGDGVEPGGGDGLPFGAGGVDDGAGVTAGSGSSGFGLGFGAGSGGGGSVGLGSAGGESAGGGAGFDPAGGSGWSSAGGEPAGGSVDPVTPFAAIRLALSVMLVEIAEPTVYAASAMADPRRASTKVYSAAEAPELSRRSRRTIASPGRQTVDTMRCPRSRYLSLTPHGVIT